MSLFKRVSRGHHAYNKKKLLSKLYTFSKFIQIDTPIRNVSTTYLANDNVVRIIVTNVNLFFDCFLLHNKKQSQGSLQFFSKLRNIDLCISWSMKL